MAELIDQKVENAKWQLICDSAKTIRNFNKEQDLNAFGVPRHPEQEQDRWAT